MKWSKPNNRKIDPEFKEGIRLLNKSGITTLGSCCGHGKYKPTIIVESNMGINMELFSGTFIPRKRKFYKSDGKGYFYIPEVEEQK